MRLKNLLREPLVQFLVLGLVFFLLWLRFGRGPAEPDNRIVISTAEIDRLAMLWERQWRRPPTEQELTSLVESRIREEVLYREALAMGLDRDDTVIRRRLAQKIGFLTEDLALAVEPTEQELQIFLDENPERFRLPLRLTFSHVYFNVDRRGEQAWRAAEELAAELARENRREDTGELGDRFMLNERYADVTPEEITRLFGSAFAAAVEELPVGEWQGPVESGYGVHLVLVEKRVEPRSPALDEVRGKVRDELITTRRREADELLYQKLREGYEIVVGEGAES